MANKGLEYEQEIYKSYKFIDMVPLGFQPAGGGSGIDFKLQLGTQQTNIELKYTESSTGSLDFGQAAMKQLEDNSWVYTNPRDTPGRELREILLSQGILAEANRVWNMKSLTEENKRKRQAKTAMAHIRDIAQFKQYTMKGKKSSVMLGFDEKVSTSNSFANAIIQYYASKGNSYIQLKGYGLFTLGNGDPLNLGATPLTIGNAYPRLRMKPNHTYRGSDHPRVIAGEKKETIGSYTFLTALKAEGIRQAPTVTNNNKSYKIDLDDKTFKEMLRQTHISLLQKN